MKKKRNRARFCRDYLPQLNEKYREFAKFLEDRSDNVVSLVQTVGNWREILDKQSKFDTYDLEQLSRYAVTLREWLQVVEYEMKNSSPANFQPRPITSADLFPNIIAFASTGNAALTIL